MAAIHFPYRAWAMWSALCALTAAPCFAAELGRRTVPDRVDPLATPMPPRAEAGILPAFDFDAGVEAEALAGGAQRHRVTQIVFVGNTVLPDEALAAVTARYEGRDVDFRELMALRDEVTRLYIDRGYVTSGARLDLAADGRLEVALVEGRLESIEVEPDGRYRPDYVADYLRGFGPTDPVNVFRIEERLQLLQRAPQVESIEARLLPGTRTGESLLWVRPHEADPWGFALQADNQLSPSLGSTQALASVAFGNALGRGDEAYFAWRQAEGLTELAAEYDVPLDARDTRLTAYAFGADSEIVTSPFDDLDIEAETRTVGLRFTRPLRRSLDVTSELSVAAEWRHSKTFLLGSGFSFVEGPDDGEATVEVLRFGWQRLAATERSVLASRLQLSAGVNAFDATIDGDGDVPDGRFAALLGQVQWAQRLAWWDSQLIARFDVQLANDPLLGLEQISLGGRATVRGYREDTLIRDEGFVFSFEWRVPVWYGGGRTRFEVRPFFDWSRSWNIERDEVGPGTLKSVGLGLYFVPMKGVDAELYWGYALNELDYASEYDIQDDGVHFRLRWEI